MKKRTTFEFDGKTGYTYVSKKYGSSRVNFEVHITVADNESDCLQFNVDQTSARSMFRSLGRACIEIDKESGLDVLQALIGEFKEELAELEDSED